MGPEKSILNNPPIPLWVPKEVYLNNPPNPVLSVKAPIAGPWWHAASFPPLLGFERRRYRRELLNPLHLILHPPYPPILNTPQ